MDLVEEEKGRRGRKQIGMREEGSRSGEEEKRQAGDAEFLASLRARLEQRRPSPLKGVRKHAVRYVQEEEEESGGRVPVGEVEHHAENRVDARGFSGSRSKDQILEGDRSIVLDQRSSQYGEFS
uniref:Uncharacterized protein n=1 Tax=Vespula pensylvanica TaxID=30213 RepID=A0A834N2D5_VESPE|nr:hypothetical protein H0235_016780 [Vespula pensylvanica]